MTKVIINETLKDILSDFVYWLNSEKATDIKYHYDVEDVDEYLKII